MENENKMYVQEMWKCGICGETYDSISKRMQCEANCLHKQELEAKRLAEAKKKEEQADRHAKVTSLIESAHTALIDYEKDYGTYVYDGEHSDAINLLKWLDWIFG